MKPRAIWSAYMAADNALSRPCGNCGANVGTWCTAIDGRVARIPHLSRAKSGVALATSTSGSVVHTGRDYSEPLHQPD